MNKSGLAVCVLWLSLLGGCAQMSDKGEESVIADPCAEDVARLERRVAKLEAELSKSRQANLALQEQNAELSKTIEMLKVLDQTVEEKRKSYSTP